MFVIRQNLKHFHETHLFPKLSIFFWYNKLCNQHSSNKSPFWCWRKQASRSCLLVLNTIRSRTIKSFWGITVLSRKTTVVIVNKNQNDTDKKNYRGLHQRFHEKKTLAFHHHLRILKTRPWQYGKSFVTRPISKLNSKIQSLDLKLKKNWANEKSKQ